RLRRCRICDRSGYVLVAGERIFGVMRRLTRTGRARLRWKVRPGARPASRSYEQVESSRPVTDDVAVIADSAAFPERDLTPYAVRMYSSTLSASTSSGTLPPRTT